MGVMKMNLGGGRPTSTQGTAPDAVAPGVRLQNAVSFVTAAVGAIKVDFSQKCLQGKDIDVLTPVFDEMTSDDYCWLFNCIDYINSEGLSLDEYIESYRNAEIEPDEMGPVTAEYKEDIINKCRYFIVEAEDGEYVLNIPRWLTAFNLHLDAPIPEQYRFTSAEALQAVDISRSAIVNADSAIRSASVSWDTFNSYWWHSKPNAQERCQLAKYFMSTAEEFLLTQTEARNRAFNHTRWPREKVCGVHYNLFCVSGAPSFTVKVTGGAFLDSDEGLLNVYIQELGKHGIKAELLHGPAYFEADDFPGAPV